MAASTPVRIERVTRNVLWVNRTPPPLLLFSQSAFLVVQVTDSTSFKWPLLTYALFSTCKLQCLSRAIRGLAASAPVNIERVTAHVRWLVPHPSLLLPFTESAFSLSLTYTLFSTCKLKRLSRAIGGLAASPPVCIERVTRHVRWFTLPPPPFSTIYRISFLGCPLPEFCSAPVNCSVCRALSAAWLRRRLCA